MNLKFKRTKERYIQDKQVQYHKNTSKDVFRIPKGIYHIKVFRNTRRCCPSKKNTKPNIERELGATSYKKKSKKKLKLNNESCFVYYLTSFVFN